MRQVLLLGRFFSVRTSIATQRPIDFLRNRIKPENNQKLEFLSALQKEKQLEPYFRSKTVDGFDVEDIYFFLTHKEMFRYPNQEVKHCLINNHNLDLYTKFVISVDIDSLWDLQIQIELLKSFNQELKNGQQEEQLAFCLYSMRKFDNLSVKGYISLNELVEVITKYYLKYEEQQQQQKYCAKYLHFLEIVWIVHDIFQIPHQTSPQPQELFPTEIVDFILQTVSPLAHAPLADLKYLYYIRDLEDRYAVKVPIKTEEHRQIIIMNKFSTTEEEFAICLLKYYSRLTYSIRMQKFSTKMYIMYLEYLAQKQLEESGFTVIQHALPLKALTEPSSFEEFSKMMRMRVQLGLEAEKDLGKHAKKLFSSFDLLPLYFFIKFIASNSIHDNEVWMDFEEAFLTKLKLKNKNRSLHKLSQEHEILSVLKCLGYLAAHQLGSFPFWSKCNRFIYELLIIRNTIMKDLTPERQNKFIIYCFQLCRNNVLSDKIQDKMVSLTLITLSNNWWSINQLYQLTKSLAYNKFGEDDLWYAIENLMMMKKLYKVTDQTMKEKVRRIIQHFQQMKKGSFKFMVKINQLNYLNVEDKADEHSQNILIQGEEQNVSIELSEDKKK